jgi:hypothetical protein
MNSTRREDLRAGMGGGGVLAGTATVIIGMLPAAAQSAAQARQAPARIQSGAFNPRCLASSNGIPAGCPPDIGRHRTQLHVTPLHRASYSYSQSPNFDPSRSLW